MTTKPHSLLRASPLSDASQSTSPKTGCDTKELLSRQGSQQQVHAASIKTPTKKFWSANQLRERAEGFDFDWLTIDYNRISWLGFDTCVHARAEAIRSSNRTQSRCKQVSDGESTTSGELGLFLRIVPPLRLFSPRTLVL